MVGEEEESSTERSVWSEDVWKSLESWELIVQELGLNCEESRCSLGLRCMESCQTDRKTAPGGKT